MGNLGTYQSMTTAAKALGGPVKALALLVGTSMIAGGALLAGAQKVAKIFRASLSDRARPGETRDRWFTVHTATEEAGGPKMNNGVRFRVLECDADAALIEVFGDPNNPYFVSADLLRSISDFPDDPHSASN